MLIGYSLKEVVDRYAKKGATAGIAAFFISAAITLAIVCVMIRVIEPVLPQLFGKGVPVRRAPDGEADRENR